MRNIAIDQVAKNYICKVLNEDILWWNLIVCEYIYFSYLILASYGDRAPVEANVT